MSVLESVVLKKVTRSYGATTALRDVSTSFLPGQLTLIKGANGSGKTTLLGILSTAMSPTHGIVQWVGLGDDPDKVRPHIGWLGHDAQVYPDLSGAENHQWYGKVYNVSSERVLSVTSRVGIGAFGQRPVRTMSRGQKQRIALAKAILAEPALLLLDEPTTGLDKEGINQLTNTLNQELTRGAVVVVVTHDVWVEERLKSRVVTLDRGRIV